VGCDGDTRAFIACDPLMLEVDFDQWQSVPTPIGEWLTGSPTPEKFVYVRNRNNMGEWDIGLSVGVEGDSKVVLINATGFKEVYDEWQLVPTP